MGIEQRFTNTSIMVVAGLEAPTAVDNTFLIPTGNTVQTLDVLANDLDGGSVPLTITDASQGAQGGVVAIGPGGSNVQYEPPSADFVGVDSFTYTIQNGDNLTDQATVTVQVGDNDKELGFRLQTTTLDGTPITTITQGSTFQLQLFIQDLRPEDGDGDGLDERGVFAAYTDLLYDSSLVSTIADPSNPFGFQVEFDEDYANGPSADDSTLNLIDELGSFQSGSIVPRGTDEFLQIAAVNLTADTAGVANFQRDPADISPFHDSLFFEPDDMPVADEVKVFAAVSISITSAVAEGETNPDNRYDVNDDGIVSPIDPLVVINHLNDPGQADGEGEASRMYLDVSGDGYITPIDVLQAINFLNDAGGSGGAGSSGGEGEAAAYDAVFGVPRTELVRSDVFTGAAEKTRLQLPEAAPVAAALSDTNYALEHDHLFADWNGNNDDDEPSDDHRDMAEEISSLLAGDVFSAWNLR